MNFVLSASRLMKASEVREFCQQTRENPVLMMALELEAKKRLFENTNERW